MAAGVCQVCVSVEAGPRQAPAAASMQLQLQSLCPAMLHMVSGRCLLVERRMAKRCLAALHRCRAQLDGGAMDAATRQ